MNKIQLLSLLLLLNVGVFAQKYSTHYKAAETHFKAKEFALAIEDYCKALEIKSDYDKAINQRGLAFEELDDLESAAIDFKKAVGLKIKEEKYHNNLGRVYYKMEKYEEAIVELSLALGRDKNNLASYKMKVYSHIALQQYAEAVETANNAVLKSRSGETYYDLGVAHDCLKQYKEAVYNYGRAKFYSPEMVVAYIGLAYGQLHLGELDKAMEAANKALGLDDKNILALRVRSEIHVANHSKQKAIEDVSRILSYLPKEVEYYILRANLYNELGQHQNAITDYSKAISIRKDDYNTYYKRAQTYEKISDFSSAIKDYEMLKELSPYDGEAMKLYDKAKARLYELNKEGNNPVITFIKPVLLENGSLAVPKGSLLFTFKGQIKDQSKITFIKVNGKDASFSKDTLNPTFEIELNIQESKELSVTAFDDYQNSETNTYKIIETEVNAPVVKIITPYASDDGTIYLDDDAPTLNIEGKIEDESLITSLRIGGSTASYVLDKLNPKFSATVEVKNKESFVVSAEDKYGNKTEQKFVLNRENAELLANNPMGKTWVIFIENAKYNSFASLDGPTKDVTLMKSAFAKYKIHNMIHKKNMTKSQLERFFSIELRDLVKKNRVNSLLVWYAGHGKFINESGYWIPVDAKRDDEFSYFNINNLKAGMQSYSKIVTHTLVVTDACESGPSFYQAMRTINENRSCNDWQATKFKSSQVFSSAGYELASDNSQFTKTFANTLNSNPNSCIPIEMVVGKVKAAVGKGKSKQKPKFGKIAGLEDENGTFFFMKK
jgi:tetratricopeptide (TPR) repeat protein